MKAKSNLSILGLAATALIAAGSAASAADFTLTVPVDVSNLPPEISTVSAYCQISTRQSGGQQVGSGSSRTQPIAGGAFRGELVVEVNAGVGRDPAAGQHYLCSLWFRGRVGGIDQEFTPFNWRYNPAAPRIPTTVDNGIVNGPTTASR